MELTRQHCEHRDAADPLRSLRDAFALAKADSDGVVYLDGNSLGALPRRTSLRVRQVIEDEWGRGLVGSWNAAGWITLAQRVGDKIGRLIGAARGEVVVSDSTSVNLYKVLSAAMSSAARSGRRRRVIWSAASMCCSTPKRPAGCTPFATSRWP